MRIKRHYCLDGKGRLKRFLDSYKIPYEPIQFSEKDSCVFVFDLYEDDDYYTKFQRQFPIASRLAITRSKEYSREEIGNAEWFEIRSMGTKVEWEYDEGAFERTCPYKRAFIKELRYRHSRQKEYLSCAKAVKWGKRQYFSGPNSADDILFCSEKAKRILGEQWKGLEFWPVKKAGKEEYILNLYQIYFARTLPVEAFSGKTISKCRFCGKSVLRTRDSERLAVSGLYLQDKYCVYTTGDICVSELSRGETFEIHIVSKEFYRYCEEKYMNSGMIYEPIDVI